MSALSAANSGSKSSRSSFAGCSTGRRREAASDFTGPEAICCPRPLGLSGCVITPTTACAEFRRCSSVGTANPGVPKKATRSGISPSPLAGLRELPDLAQDQITRDAPQAIDEETRVEVIDFMLQGAREQAAAFEPVLLAVAIQALDDDASGPRYRGREPRDAQAAFLFELHAVALDELRIDHRMQLNGVLAEG